MSDAEHVDTLPALSIPFADRVVEALAGTVTGMPVEESFEGVPVAATAPVQSEDANTRTVEPAHSALRRQSAT